MVLCVVDDLMFSVRISTAAKHLGTPLVFERSADKVVESVRDKRPQLVVFDLNGARTRPLDAIRAIKADPELKDVPLLGFVSHMDVATITAAREAGVDEVLARSAFVERLSEILTPRITPR